MEENPSSGANSTSVSPQIPRLFWKRKVHPSIRKSLLLVHILRNTKTMYDTEQISLIYTLIFLAIVQLDAQILFSVFIYL